MSQQDSEIVRRQFQAWNAGDFNEWSEAWDPDVVVVAPEGWPDRMLARIRYVTKSAETGLPFETSMAAVFFVRAGKIKRAQYCWTVGEALEAAGPTE